MQVIHNIKHSRTIRYVIDQLINSSKISAKEKINYLFLFVDESRLYTECSDFVNHKTLTLEGKIFHYVEVGDVSKPLILFLHGFPQVF